MNPEDGGKRLELWTWHGPDFSLLEGRVDHQRSEVYQTIAGVPAAYAELAKRTGTDQWIWCSKRRSIPPRNAQQFRWTLNVPADRFIAVVDGRVWERIIGVERSELSPAQLWSSLFINDLSANDATILIPHPIERAWRVRVDRQPLRHR